MIFLVLSGKMIFLFPENIILFFRWKMKDDLSQKKYMEIWYLFQIVLKDGLSKNIALESDLSCCIIWKDDFFPPPKDMILFSRRKMKDDLSPKKYMETWYYSSNAPKRESFQKKYGTGIWSFLYYLERWYFSPGKYDILSLNERWSFSRNTWKYDIFCIYV